MILTNGTAHAQWETLPEALQNAQKDSLPIFVSYYADWCIPCQIMDANVFNEPNVQKILFSEFHAVRLNVESKQKIFCDGDTLFVNDCFSQKMNLKGIPSYAILAPNGISLLTLSGALDADSFIRFLQKILNTGLR